MLVVGVFLGIQVANWNDARVERNRELVFLAQLRVEITDNVATIEHQLRYQGQLIASGRRALAPFDKPLQLQPVKRARRAFAPADSAEAKTIGAMRGHTPCAPNSTQPRSGGVFPDKRISLPTERVR